MKTIGFFVLCMVLMGICSVASAVYAPQPCKTCSVAPAPTTTTIGIDFNLNKYTSSVGIPVSLNAYQTTGVALLMPNWGWQASGNIPMNGASVTFTPTKKGKYSFQVSMYDPVTLQTGYMKKSNVLTVT